MHTPRNAHEAEAGTATERLCKALTLSIVHNYTHRATKMRLGKSELTTI